MKNNKIKKLILKIVERIKEKYQPEKIILYGSFAYGKPNSESDIDLLIIKDTKDRPIDRRIVVRQIVKDIKNGIPFQAIVITPEESSYRLKIGDQFFKEVLTKGKILYAR